MNLRRSSSRTSRSSIDSTEMTSDDKLSTGSTTQEAIADDVKNKKSPVISTINDNPNSDDVSSNCSDGSDEFLPGGNIVKATETPEKIINSAEEETLSSNDEKESENENQMDDQSTALNENSPKFSNENFSSSATYNVKTENNKLLDNSEIIDLANENIRENIIENSGSDIKINTTTDVQESDDEDSRSGCLEINTEPNIDEQENNEKETTENENKDIVKEKNIFSNPDIFYENHALDGKEDDHEKEKETNRDKSDNEVDEHNISDDFKIGQEDEGCKENAEAISTLAQDDSSSPLPYDMTEANIYLIDKKKSRSGKDDRRLLCECPFEPDDPLFVGCDENCLNRLLMIECNNRCPTAEFCTNRNFQKGCRYDVEIFNAGKKGWGLKTNEPITKGSFIIEYCGEVVDYNDFHKRTEQYHDEGMQHYYFMTLKTNEIIDATKKGSKSRFINHSCNPNSVTQKWTVNGFLRIGFFALHHIDAGEELSFDYQFQRYGEKPQDCFCGAENCRGVIGTEQIGAIPSYFEKMMSDSPSTSSKRKKREKERKEQMKEYYDSALAEELTELLGAKMELCTTEQTLELLRLMVKVETLRERRELLKILQSSQDVSALKAFVRYKGLSLLWSWMVDASEDKVKYKTEILKTLKHIPIPNKNELDDSKLSAIVLKWSKPVPQDDDKMEDCSDEETQSPSDSEVKNDEGGSTSQDESSREDEGDFEKKVNTSLGAESFEEGEILETEEDTGEKKSKKKDKMKNKLERQDSRKREIASLSASLLEDWKVLKEVFRIPKKSQTPDRRPKVDSEGSPLLDEKRIGNKVADPPSQQPPESTPINSSTTKQAKADSTFSSPPSKRRQLMMHKGIGAFLMRAADDSENTSEVQTSSTVDEVSNSISDNKRNTRREWRKSPNSSDQNTGGKDELVLNDSGDYGAITDLAGSRRGLTDSSDNSKGNRRDSRWNRDRDRRRSYDGDCNRNDNNFDNQSGDNERNRGWGGGSRWGRSRNWNDRGSNRGGRLMRDRGKRSSLSGDETDNSWRGRNDSWGNQQLQQQPHFGDRNMTLPIRTGIQPLMRNDQNCIPMGNQPRPRHPMFPNNNSSLLSQPSTNILPHQPSIMPGNRASHMFPHPPMPPQINPMLSNQVRQNSPLVSPMSNQAYNAIPLPPSSDPTYAASSGKYNSPVQPDVSALNVVNQLQLLLNAERLKQAHPGSHPGTPDFSRGPTSSPHRTSSGTSPTRSKPVPALPPHWKTATDSEGRMYYYHSLTRETSWDPPTQANEVEMEERSPPKRNKKRLSTEDPRSPPTNHSPRIAAADTTHHHGPRTPPALQATKSEASKATVTTTELQRIRDTFKVKISSVVVNCLNQYQKVDCKQGRIKNVEDFKFLARKLTHGLIMKEVQRIKNEELLNCNDSVKMKVKEYIRHYMKKFGAYYVRS